MVGRRRLDVTLFERFAVPNSITLVDCDVVHMDRNPNVGSGVGDFVVNIVVDDKMFALVITVLDVVNAGLVYLCKIKPYIIVFVICAPEIGFVFVNHYGFGVFVDFENLGCWQNLVFLVKFYNSSFGLRRNVSHLRETDVWLANPSVNGVRLYGPRDYLAGFAMRNNATEHKPSVLSQHTSVVKF